MSFVILYASTHSLVPGPKAMVVGLGARLVSTQVKLRVDQHTLCVRHTLMCLLMFTRAMDMQILGKFETFNVFHLFTWRPTKVDIPLLKE